MNRALVNIAAFTPFLSSCDENTSFVRFLGTGSSTGCPRAACLFSTSPTPPNCENSKLASIGDPRFNKNYRNNPSLLIHHHNHTVVIDAGKTFRESLTRWLPTTPNIDKIDAIVLTHEHMDAFGGMDDIRGTQIFKNNVVTPMLCFLNAKTREAVSGAYPYLFPKKIVDENEVKRMVAAIDFKEISDFTPFKVSPDSDSFSMTPIPVKHGEDCSCLGFSFGPVIYLSDISRLTPEAASFIFTWQKTNTLDLLVLDCLFFKGSHNTHYALDDVAKLVAKLNPKKTVLVGMSCDSVPAHDEANKMLKLNFPKHDVSLAYDGLKIELPNFLSDELVKEMRSI